MRCPVSRKIQYDSERQALAYAEAFNLKQSAYRRVAMRAYPCPDCCCWHLATKKNTPTSGRRRKLQAKRAKARLQLAISTWEGEGGA